MAVEWSTKRQVTIAAILLIIFGTIGAGFITYFSYEEPTCSDGEKNQQEVGVDCGGPCSRLCDSQTSQPVVKWKRIFPAVGNTYHLVAFIENSNPNAEAKKVPYQFQIFDKDNVKLKEVTGTTFIPPEKSFAIFEGRVSVPEEPARVTFQFSEKVTWYRTTDERRRQKIEIVDQTQTGLKASPRVQATVRNITLQSIPAVELVAMVLDSEQNVVGVSRTIERNVQGEEERRVTFTWAQPFDLGTRTCKQPTDVMVVLDRSGSMNDDNEDPPQPLTSVKNAARTFVDRLANKDKAGLVTFATEAMLETKLTTRYRGLKSTIDAISIQSPEHEQHTNIAAGLRNARTELTSPRHSSGTRQAIVLLTDGIASRPLAPEDSQVSDEEYPKQRARNVAESIRSEDMDLYIIGLGDKVNNEFLRALAGSQENYFFAPESEQLNTIYKDVATSICERGPSSVQIHTRILPDSQ